MAKVYGQKNNLLPNRSKAASSLPHPLFSMLYGWGLAPAFLASSTLSNGGGGEVTLGQKKKNLYFGRNIIAQIQSWQKYVAKRTIYYQIDKKNNQFSPPPLFSMLYGWGFAPVFLTSPTLSNGGRGGDFRAKEGEFLL